MKQVYLDSIILKVIENTGNDPLIREDFIRRVVRDQVKQIVPMKFFPVKVVKANVADGLIEVNEPYLSIIAVNKPEKTETSVLYMLGDDIYEPYTTIQNQDYITESSILEYCKGLNYYAFTEDSMNGQIYIYTDLQEVSVFFYTMYRDTKGRTVVPEFTENYLLAYGTMRALEVQLNRTLRGKQPTSVLQTRQTLAIYQRKTTNEFISMQREIQLLSEKVILKPVNRAIDATI